MSILLKGVAYIKIWAKLIVQGLHEEMEGPVKKQYISGWCL